MELDVRGRSVILTWKPPESDGGSPVTGYIVETSTLVGECTIHRDTIELPANQTVHREQDVNPSEFYLWRVAARNASGTGPYFDCEFISI